MYSARENTDNTNRNDSTFHEKQQWYPVVCKEDVTLTQNGLSLQQREFAWNQLHSQIFSYQNTFLGFQSNQSVDFGRTKEFLRVPLNNDGDPFSLSSLNSVNTKIMECAVLDYFAKLWGIQQSDVSNEEDRAYWGYVTSMGASEANLAALFNARDYLAGFPLVYADADPDSSKVATAMRSQSAIEIISNSIGSKSSSPINITASSQDQRSGNLSSADMKNNPNNFTPVTFFAEESHHGFDKASRILQIKSFSTIGSGNFPCPLKYPDDYPTNFNPAVLDENGWPNAVPTEADGSISIPCLSKLVTAFVSRGYPPIVVFTMGTTFKGANDNPQAAINELVPILKQHNMYERRVCSSEDPTKSDIRSGFWFHIDGALCAAQLRFLEMAINEGLVPNMFRNGFPVFDFRIPEVKSIAMSLHKWLGCPFPSSIFMMRKMDQVKPPEKPLYIGGLDSTLSSSRGGHSTLVMWDLLSKKSYEDFKELAVSAEQMVEFSLKELEELQRQLPFDLWLSHTQGSLFVYFRQPREDIVRRYCLASKPLKIKTADGTFEHRLYSHICLMPHVSKNLVLQFVKELRAPGAFSSHD